YFKIFYRLVFKNVEILSAYLYRSFFTKNSDRAFHIFPVAVNGIVDGAYGSVFKFQYHTSIIFKFTQPVMYVIFAVCIYRFTISNKPVKQVNEMTELSIQCPSVKIFFAFPVRLLIVFIISVPETVQLRA